MKELTIEERDCAVFHFIILTWKAAARRREIRLNQHQCAQTGHFTILQLKTSKRTNDDDRINIVKEVKNCDDDDDVVFLLPAFNGITWKGEDMGFWVNPHLVERASASTQ